MNCCLTARTSVKNKGTATPLRFGCGPCGLCTKRREARKRPKGRRRQRQHFKLSPGTKTCCRPGAINGGWTRSGVRSVDEVEPPRDLRDPQRARRRTLPAWEKQTTRSRHSTTCKSKGLGQSYFGHPHIAHSNQSMDSSTHGSLLPLASGLFRGSKLYMPFAAAQPRKADARARRPHEADIPAFPFRPTTKPEMEDLCRCARHTFICPLQIRGAGHEPSSSLRDQPRIWPGETLSQRRALCIGVLCPEKGASSRRNYFQLDASPSALQVRPPLDYPWLADTKA